MAVGNWSSVLTTFPKPCKLIWHHVEHSPDALNDCFIILERCILIQSIIITARLLVTRGDTQLYRRKVLHYANEPGHHPCKTWFPKTTSGVVLQAPRGRDTCVCVSLLVVRYPFCCWINGAIDQRQTCVSQRTADHSPTAGPDTGAPIGTATARMITDAWLGRAAEEPPPPPPPTPSSSDRLTVIGGRSCGRSGG